MKKTTLHHTIFLFIFLLINLTEINAMEHPGQIIQYNIAQQYRPLITLYECNVCCDVFTTNAGLNSHKRVHNQPFKKVHKCNKCDKSFLNSGTLKIHIRVHTKEKPYACEVCPKRFAQNNNLIKHIRVHTKEKPYICELCSKDFTQKHSLIMHKKSNYHQDLQTQTPITALIWQESDSETEIEEDLS
jgi:hypothetical protein